MIMVDERKKIAYFALRESDLERLKQAGAEQRLWPTQFGFRTGVGTAEALFVARRQIDQAWMMKSGETFMLALDWAKAFDSISQKELIEAVRRMNVPDSTIK